jgi:hypothetical protein
LTKITNLEMINYLKGLFRSASSGEKAKKGRGWGEGYSSWEVQHLISEKIPAKFMKEAKK